jgi:ubiquinone/menaquinone biosynthesis C-methylase UbiE
MAGSESPFKHSTPDLYDRFMGPLLFEPFAKIVAERAARFGPARILEIAAGTGIVTRALHEAVPTATIVATDINPAMLAHAAQQVRSELVSFEPANAQELPFDSDAFDLVICQFGIMFFPDKIAANREARRVLRPGGRYLLATFDALEQNPVPKAAGEAVASLFAQNPRYMERGPFSYTDAQAIEDDLRAAGFADVAIETVAPKTRVNARDAAVGIVLGSPFRAEIEKLGPSALDRALAAVTESLSRWDGKDAPMSAHILTAVK